MPYPVLPEYNSQLSLLASEERATDVHRMSLELIRPLIRYSLLAFLHSYVGSGKQEPSAAGPRETILTVVEVICLIAADERLDLMLVLRDFDPRVL